MLKQLTNEEKIKIIKENGGGKENILSILLDLQKASPQGCIDRETAILVADQLNMSEARVYEIASYYAMLKTKPQAKNVIEVCNSSPCYFSKSDEVVAVLKSELGINLGEVTEDGLFTIVYTPCVGACDIGPVIKIQDQVYGNLNGEKIKAIIQDLKA